MAEGGVEPPTLRPAYLSYRVEHSSLAPVAASEQLPKTQPGGDKSPAVHWVATDPWPHLNREWAPETYWLGCNCLRYYSPPDARSLSRHYGLRSGHRNLTATWGIRFIPPCRKVPGTNGKRHHTVGFCRGLSSRIGLVLEGSYLLKAPRLFNLVGSHSQVNYRRCGPALPPLLGGPKPTRIIPIAASGRRDASNMLFQVSSVNVKILSSVEQAA